MAIPIPPKPSGYRIGAAHAPIQVDAFIDVQCEYWRRAWPMLQRVCARYGADTVALTVHLTVISHHGQSWDVSRAAVAVAKDDSEVFARFLSFLYKRQDQYLNGASRHRSPAELHSLLAQFAGEFDPSLDKDEFLRRFDSDEVFAATKVPIRYGISRGVWSTPTFFINGSEASGLSSSSSVEDWQAVLDPLVAA